MTTLRPTTTTTNPIPNKHGKDYGLIVGLIIGAVVLLGFVGWLIWRKIKANNSQGESTSLIANNDSLRIEDFNFRNEEEAEAALGAAYWPDVPRHVYIKK